MVPIRTRLRLPLAALAAAALVGLAAGPAAAAEPDTERPTAPAGVAATWESTSMHLSWTASADNVGVTGYEISVRVDDTDAIQMYRSTTNALTVRAASGVSHRYQVHVRAFDAAGNVASSGTVTLWGPQADTFPPSTPPGLRAEYDGGPGVVLTWGRSTDNAGVERYDVLSLDEGDRVVGTYRPMLWNHSPHAAVTGVAPDTTYRYAVRAVDLAGNASPPSAPVSVRTWPVAECGVGYRVVSRWDTGHLAEVTVRHQRPAALAAWTVGWAPVAGQTVTSLWNARLTGTDPVTVESPAWRPALDGFGTATFGLVSAGPDPSAPAGVTLNGKACAAL